VLDEGGGAEGVADRGVLVGVGAKCTVAFLGFALFSCSLSDIAMASCRSSSSCPVPPPPPGEAEEDEVGGP
jgi:hypothetical protein